MNIFEAILTRKIATNFEKKDIDDRLIGLLLHSAIHAPSAGNLKEWRFIVVRQNEIKEKLSDLAYNEKIIKEAPIDIVVCADLEALEAKYKDKGKKYLEQDVGFAAMIILLGARALGLSCTLIRNFKTEDVKELLELPDFLEPSLIIPVGYAIEEKEIETLDYENLTYFNKYGRKYEVEIKPLFEYIRDFLKRKKENKDKKKSYEINFETILKRLAR